MVSNSDFMKVFHSSPVPMSLSRASDGKFAAVNDEFLRLSGYAIHEILGNTTAELQMWVDPSQRDQIHAQIRTEGFLRNHELEVRRKDGNILTVLWSADIVTFKEESHLLVSAYDITDRKRAEISVQERENLFRSIIDSAPIGMHFYEVDDGELILKAANPAADRIASIDSKPLIGKRIQDAFPPLAHTDIPDAYMKVAKDGEPWSRSAFTYEVADENTAYDIHAFQTGPLKMCVMFTDVSDHVLAEQEREFLESRLRIAQKMEAIGHLAGGIAHDFNNLLSPIMGYTELVLARNEVSNSVKQDLSEVMRASERAKALINQLLAFSRKQVLEVKTIDLCRVISSFMNVLRHTIREEIDMIVDNKIECGCISGDIGQIEQILLNLAINAQDAMDAAGKITISLDRRTIGIADIAEISGLSPGKHIILSVKDTGPGISDEIRQHLFEPFFTTKNPGKGTGLGLSTVYGIIKQHQGSIQVSNGSDGGALFCIYFPEVEDCAELETESTGEQSASSGTECILLVEDDRMVREMTERMLISRGFDVITSDDALHAITLFESNEHKIDLLLTDVVMPGLSGKEIFERLHLANPSLKVLYMSGYENSILGDRGVLEDGVNFIQKPFTLPRLVEKINTIINVESTLE